MSTSCLADPPYVGEARRKYGGHWDYAGEVDHAELIDRMCSDFGTHRERRVPKRPDAAGVLTLFDDVEEAAW